MSDGPQPIPAVRNACAARGCACIPIVSRLDILALAGLSSAVIGGPLLSDNFNWSRQSTDCSLF